ncbi:homoserine O-acetyltransferase [Roseivirga sp. UBA1976]|uniref:homoserine O-acetyltransferase family protein n=1 Tax=Roseivirga sp. UBA1976 TaxID=1947386 RepID=UPI0025811A40|nr:homoserine O-acetyltransferase [Roseivirga sp. UBA1976]|tara:strand:- start:4672 stop:5739 length:1068 start_codon:yes stop_codon:yes gene_type:complete
MLIQSPKGSAVASAQPDAIQQFIIKGDFSLENGSFLTDPVIAYHTFGKLNASKSNVVWICHALTANANPLEWWPGLVGEQYLINPSEHFIVCANILGSCYGSTGPKDFNPATGERYLRDFPLLTIRDMVKAHEQLRQHLGINRIYLGLGGSMGGQQILEWAIESPTLFENLCIIAAGAKSSPWGIGIRSAQRMAIEADPSFFSSSPKGGWKGLEAARAMAMISYRTDKIYNENQEDGQEKIDGFNAESYQRYQGLKLQKRFNAHSYYALSKCMDSHDVGRKRGGVQQALKRVKANTLVIGINSDLLFTRNDQQILAHGIKHSKLTFIDSNYGHDGFLVEAKTISTHIENFLNEHP